MRESISALTLCAGAGGAAVAARAVCVHGALKLAARLLRAYERRGDRRSVLAVLHEILAGVRPLLSSEDMEVQERAHNTTALMALVLSRVQAADDGPLVDHEQSNGFEKNENGEIIEEENSKSLSGGLIEEIVSLFEGELKPVAPKAQKKVPIPADLDLNQWLSRDRWSSDSSSSESDEEGAALFTAPQEDNKPVTQFTPEELQMLREARRQEQANNPHYLKDDSPRSYQQDDIPIAEIALEIPLQVQTKRSDKYLISRENSKKPKKEKRTSKKRKGKIERYSSDSDSDEVAPRGERPAVAEGGELPDGAALSDDEQSPHDDPHRALDLDLDLPLHEEELLSFGIQQYPLPESGLLIKKKESKKNKSSEKRPSEKTSHKKKVKNSKRNKKIDLMLPESANNNDLGDNLLIETGDDISTKNNVTIDDVSDEKHQEKLKTEKHKKSKKYAKDKDSKKNKTSKKDKHETKIGYEEALGISTPSKEVV